MGFRFSFSFGKRDSPVLLERNRDFLVLSMREYRAFSNKFLSAVCSVDLRIKCTLNRTTI